MPIRPPSSPIMAILKPSPSWPRMAVLGTRTSSSTSSDTAAPRMPILSSVFPQETPGILRSTKKAVVPLAPMPGSVTAMTTKWFPSSGPRLEMKHLVPLSM